MNSLKALYFNLLFVALFSSCINEPKTLFENLASDYTGVKFINTVENKTDFNIFSYRNFYNGGGVGLGDINNDGLIDIYLTGNQTENKLFLNKGNFKFDDITASAGVKGTKLWSTGVSMIDINNDGFLDIYVSNAGYSKGSNQENELFINNGDLTFTESAEQYGLDDNGYTTHVAFFDYDLDGDLDAYILNNSFIPVNSLNYNNKRELYAEDWEVMDFVKGGGDKLLENQNGYFKDVTRDAGIYGSLIGFGLGVTIGDVNSDNLPDIFVSNDFFEKDYLYINQGNGKFQESLENWVGHTSLASMGADMGDLNNDGLPELFVTEMLPETDQLIKQKSQFDNYNVFKLKEDRGFYYQYMHNTLQLNNGNNRFQEVAWYSGVAASDWSWGALMFDANMDGLKDIFVSNGVYQDVTDQDFIDFFANDVVQEMVLTGVKEEMSKVLEKMPTNPQPNKLFLNNGNMSFKSVENEFGLGEASFSNGSAYGDLDNDGDLDLIVNNLNQETFVYRNNSREFDKKNFITVSLEGDINNRQAVGAKVAVYIQNQSFHAELVPTRGFQSSVDTRLNFGLNSTNSVDSLVVIWPNKTKSTIVNPGINQFITIKFISTPKMEVADERSPNPQLFSQTKSPFQRHQEDDYVDFYNEGLLIKKLSKEGPVIEVADLNNDGLMDVVLGTSKGHPSELYIQKVKGQFQLQPNSFENSNNYEDTAIEAIDVDNDGDLDLYIGSGGNIGSSESLELQDRLYINNGSGSFSVVSSNITLPSLNTSVVIALDYDEDGDSDLFVGSRSIPGNYGVSPKSYLLENNGKGIFSDVTIRRARVLNDIGMVTSAELSDLDNNGIKELIIVGEWMAPQVLEIKGRKLTKKTSSLDSLSGWWNTVEVADLDNDGDNDLILGNRGENFYFSASPEKPAKLWLSDFDQNGSIENIITRTIDGKDLPLTLKKELTAEIPILKKQNLKNSDFSRKTIQDLFSESSIENAEVKQATYFKSIVAINMGNGNFSIRDLPWQTQLSSINAILVEDFDNDGLVDLLLAGNSSDFTPQFSRLDANMGSMLKNLGDADFEVMPANKSGLNLRGDIKFIQPLEIYNKRQFIIGVNNGPSVLLQYNHAAQLND